MILVRSPLRISIGGGGTDLSSYYNKYGGQVISTTIDKYVYIIISKPFTDEFILKYSQNEKVKNIKDIKHKIIKSALLEKKYKCKSIEITSLADIPAGTGLGSSGAFSTALIKGLNTYFKIKDNKKDIARFATNIELKSLNKFVGLQDQFASSYGGLNIYKFNKNSSTVNRLNIDSNLKQNLDENILLYYSGITRKSSKILKQQTKKINDIDNNTLSNLHRIKIISNEMKNAILLNDFPLIGDLLNEQWQLKKNISKKISNNAINELYDYGIKNGAYGGKLLGAGGGGFLLFLAKDKKKLQSQMKKRNIIEIPFSFENEGVKVVYK